MGAELIIELNITIGLNGKRPISKIGKN